MDSNLRSPRYPTLSGDYHPDNVKFLVCVDINTSVACRLRIGLLVVRLIILTSTSSSRLAALMSLLYLCCTAVRASCFELAVRREGSAGLQSTTSISMSGVGDVEVDAFPLSD